MIPFKVIPMIILQHIAFSKKTSSPVAKKSDIERTHHKRVQILRMILDICLIAVLISNVASENNVHIDFVIYLLISMSMQYVPSSYIHHTNQAIKHLVFATFFEKVPQHS